MKYMVSNICGTKVKHMKYMLLWALLLILFTILHQTLNQGPIIISQVILQGTQGGLHLSAPEQTCYVA